MSRPSSALLGVTIGGATLAASASALWIVLAVSGPAPLWAVVMVPLALLVAGASALAGRRRLAAAAALVGLLVLLTAPTGVESLAVRFAALVFAAGVLVAVEAADALARLRRTQPPPSQEVISAVGRALVARLALLVLLVAPLALAPPIVGPGILPELAASGIELFTPWAVAALAGILLGGLLLVGVRRHARRGPVQGEVRTDEESSL